jgi:hypothetical protein
VSSLFRLANAAARALSGAGIQRALRSPQARQSAVRLAEASLSPDRYEQGAETAVNQFMRSLGPLGKALSAALGGRTALRSPSQVESAIALIRALGGDVIVRDPQSPHYKRGLRAARQLLEELDRLPEPTPAPAMPPPAGPPRIPAAAPGDEWPEEHDIQLLGRGAAQHAPDWEALQRKEIKTPGSSNVYSFIYEPETDSVGILYVTFRLWHPGMKGPRPNQPGPTYAYYDVPLRKYKTFERRAKESAGKAVWDYLRVRGSKWDHRHPYRLVQGAQVPLGGVYVPRKATKLGFRRRSLPAIGVGRRSFIRSTLPEDIRALPNRATPNRARPNRGTPNRGEPDQG